MTCLNRFPFRAVASPPLAILCLGLGLAGCGASHGRHPPAPAMNVAPGLGVVCLVGDDGTAACQGLTVGSSVPVEVLDLPQALSMPNAVAITGRNQHGCALSVEGDVYCWGDSGAATVSGQPSDNPLRVEGLPAVVSVSAGRDHSCAVGEDGGVYCWGSNTSGELGVEPSSDGVANPDPIAVAGIDDAVLVSAGGSHTCAVLSGGQVACWGGNSRGQLGTGGLDNQSSHTPIVIDGLGGVFDLDTGTNHSCVITADRAVSCWGGNLGSEADRRLPERIAGAAGVLDVVAGRSHTCALHFTGTVSCWGSGQAGQLGPDAEAFTRVAQHIEGLAGVEAISAGGDYTCAVLMSGGLRCWGGDYPAPSPNNFGGGS